MAETVQDLTVAQFAGAIRTKYPDSQLYKTKSDFELTEAFIKAKPENAVYKNRIKDYNSASITAHPPGPAKPAVNMQENQTAAGITGAGKASTDAGTGIGGATQHAVDNSQERKKMAVFAAIGAGGALAGHVAGLGAAELSYQTERVATAEKDMKAAYDAVKAARATAQAAQQAKKGADAAKAMKGVREASRAASEARKAYEEARTAKEAADSTGKLLPKIVEHLKGPGQYLNKPGGRALEYVIEGALLKYLGSSNKGMITKILKSLGTPEI